MQKTELVEVLNSFISSSIEVLDLLTGIEAHRGQIEKKVEAYKAEGVFAILGLVGKEKGRVFINMSKETAKAIAGKINEEEFTEIDDNVLFSIAELTNMVSGGAITKINNDFRDYNLRLTPPGIFWGDEVEITSSNFKVLSITMNTEVGSIGVNIGFEGVEL